MARPHVLDAARVKENCFSLSFIAAPSCQAWRRASTGKFCQFPVAFAPSPRAWAGGSGRAARQCASSSAIPGQTGPEEAGARHKPAFKPARKTTVLSRSAQSRNPASGPHPRTVRRCSCCWAFRWRIPHAASRAAWAGSVVGARLFQSAQHQMRPNPRPVRVHL